MNWFPLSWRGWRKRRVPVTVRIITPPTEEEKRTWAAPPPLKSHFFSDDHEKMCREHYTPVLFQDVPINGEFYHTGMDSGYTKTGPSTAIMDADKFKGEQTRFYADHEVWVKK